MFTKASVDLEIKPSLLPVGTLQNGPPYIATHTHVINNLPNKYGIKMTFPFNHLKKSFLNIKRVIVMDYDSNDGVSCN